MSERRVDWAAELADQLDWHWTHQLRPRLEGLSDDEYLWEPAQPAWTVRHKDAPTPAGASMRGGAGEWLIDFEYPQPEPTPVPTIAWRLGHVISGVLAMRNALHFGHPQVDPTTWPYTPHADEAIAQLEGQYGRWIAGVRDLDEAALAAPCGEVGPWGEAPMAMLVLHINREFIHHMAEVALLRDLYVARAWSQHVYEAPDA